MPTTTPRNTQDCYAFESKPTDPQACIGNNASSSFLYWRSFNRLQVDAGTLAPDTFNLPASLAKETIEVANGSLL